MLSITITTSAGRFTMEIASPVDDSVTIHYNDCLYCGKPFRQTGKHPGKYCSDYHRSVYYIKGIGKLEQRDSIIPDLLSVRH